MIFQLNRSRQFGLQFLLAAVFVSIAIAGYTAFARYKDTLLQEQINRAQTRTDALESRIDRWLSTRKTEIATLANTPTIRSMDWNQSGPFLKAKHVAMPWIYIFAHINPDGTYYNSKVDFAKGKNLKDRAHFKAAMAGQVYASDPVVSRTLGTDIVAVTSPIYENDDAQARIIGVFGGMIDTQTIVSELAAFDNGPGSYAFAINSAGIAIAHPDSTRMGNINTKAISLTEDKDQGLAELASKMSSGETGWVETRIDGQQVFANFAPLEEADWYIATITDADYLRGTLLGINVIGLLGLVLLIAGYALASSFIRLEVRRIDQDRILSEEKSKAKSIFLANMSHELRTPLNGILGYTQILLGRSGTSAEDKKYLNTVLSSGRHLLSLINRVLDLSKIEAGRLELDPRPTHLKTVLEEVARLLKVENDKRSTSFSSQISERLDQVALIDSDKLKQILNNIAVNAFKYGGTGEVSLSADLADTSEKPRLQLCIEDHGIGMTEEQIARVFEPFDQVNAKAEGAGLGMSIVKALVQLMGGSIEITSTPGLGTRIEVELPLDLVEASALSREMHDVDAPIGKASEQKRILIIDDNQTNRDFMRDLLVGVGFSVETAEDGAHGLALIANEDVDLVITDLVMPKVDGFGVITGIRSGNRNSRVPIIVASASAFPDDQIRSVAIGADVFVSKPLDVRDLLDRIGNLLDVRYISEHENRAATSAHTATTRLGTEYTLDARDSATREVLDQIRLAADLGRTNHVKRLIENVADDQLKSALTAALASSIEALDSHAIVTIVDEWIKSA